MRDCSGRRRGRQWCTCYVKIKAVNNDTSWDTKRRHEKCICSSHGASEFLSVLAQLYYVVSVSRTASPRRIEVLSSAGRTQPVSLHYPSIQRSYQALALAPWHVCSVPLFAFCLDELLSEDSGNTSLTPQTSASGSFLLKWVSSEKSSHLTPHNQITHPGYQGSFLSYLQYESYILHGFIIFAKLIMP